MCGATSGTLEGRPALLIIVYDSIIKETIVVERMGELGARSSLF